MNESAELAAQLRDIHLPPPPPWWPPQPGWWLIALAALLLCLWWLRRPPAWKREALARLNAADADFARHGNAARLLAEISVLLRRCALALRDRGQVAGLVGEDWVGCLRELGGGVCPMPEEALVHGAYQARPELDPQAVSRGVADWIRRARAPRGRLS